jgi:outer membrane receptor protein involved in Fe transport
MRCAVHRAIKSSRSIGAGWGGGQARQTWFGDLGGHSMENTVGLQLRSDWILNGLFQTVNRHRTEKVDYNGAVIPATTRQDDVWEASLAPYLENKMQWFEWMRTVVGVRADLYHFDVKGNQRENSGTVNKALVSPKATVAFGPWAGTELYLSGGARLPQQ